MKIFAVKPVFWTLALILLAGCTDKNGTEPDNRPVPGYIELIEAYEAEKVFAGVDLTGGNSIVSFTDNSAVTVPETSFRIYDCREKVPANVTVENGRWSIDGMIYPIVADSSLPREEASVVYACYDLITLRLWLSNCEVLEFKSVQSEMEAETERRQNIPVLRIVTDNSAPILDKKNYVDGTISIYDPEHLYSSVTEQHLRMGIRGRGNSTWSFPKKPWKVKLKEKESVLGMPADKEWALLANYADRTLLRNVVALKISEFCGFSWTPKLRSVEVWLNDEYQGVYTLCEHKKVSPDRVDISPAGPSDNDGEAVSGDYYLEIEEQQDETVCWWTGLGVPMMFSDPEEPTDRQQEYVKSYIAAFEKALTDKNYDPDSGYPSYIDTDSFIDNFIIQELTKNIDGDLRKSSFLTKEKGKKLEMYHVWDFDLTLGNCGYFPGGTGNGYDKFWIKDKKWYGYLFSDPSFVVKVQKRWKELLPQLLTIPSFIRQEALYLEKARARNFERWDIRDSIDWVMFPSLGSYEKELDYLIDFYSMRLEWLDNEISRL